MYQVELKGNDIYVSADPEEVKKNARITKPPQGTKSDEKGVVIVGGGSGGLYAVEGLREVSLYAVSEHAAADRSNEDFQSGYSGPIRVISKEKYIPIDRTKLSKALIDDAGKLAVREESWYKENAIDFNLGTVVKSVDIEGQSVTTEDGQTFGYDHLVLASGAAPTVSYFLPT